MRLRERDRPAALLGGEHRPAAVHLGFGHIVGLQVCITVKPRYTRFTVVFGRSVFWSNSGPNHRCSVGVDIKAILTPPFTFCIDNHEWNTQGGVRMTLTSRASAPPGRPPGAAPSRRSWPGPRVWTHCRFRNRSTDYVRESGIKRMSVSTKRQLRPSPVWTATIASESTAMGPAAAASSPSED